MKEIAKIIVDLVIIVEVVRLTRLTSGCLHTVPKPMSVLESCGRSENEKLTHSDTLAMCSLGWMRLRFPPVPSENIKIISHSLL